MPETRVAPNSTASTPGQSGSREQGLIETVRLDGRRDVAVVLTDRGRDLLREELVSICDVEQIAVYAQMDALHMDQDVLDHLRRGEIDYVTLTSANIARALVAGMDATCRARIAAGEMRLVSISPGTSAEVRQLGLPVAAEAREATAEGVVEAMLALAAREARASTVGPEGHPS